ncbi:hypothetical protein AArcCO_0833 [Halalkaliarchaeum sp. AArc-CO]|uniref:hypothetical protein n=1 Tax=Halalkaliarchaeum sp. AArc-CO TaxID=2866381 RepID=UPI00217D9A43|nr:hypothetical protein [Halalkaliarchaeum sp. AArc-CO]UWG50151.1 hypothetical protein AArcCO_0833 [Halalkaliarchaeum sp. AArc-CO]
MPRFEHGIERGVGMVIEAIIVAILFSAFVEAGLIPRLYFILFNMASIVGLVFLIDKSRYWSYGYLLGWVFGIVLTAGTLIQTELFGWFDLLLYGATASAAVYLRLKIRL